MPVSKVAAWTKNDSNVQSSVNIKDEKIVNEKQENEKQEKFNLGYYCKNVYLIVLDVIINGLFD